MSRILLFVALMLLCPPILTADSQALNFHTLALSAYVNDYVWDATRSVFFATSGPNILMINPQTAQVEDTIAVGAAADRIAVSDDGQYLYAGIGSQAVIRRFRIASHTNDLSITLGLNGAGQKIVPAAMVVLPGQPQSILVATGLWPGSDSFPFANTSQALAIFDGAVQRPNALPLSLSSLYVRPTDGTVFGWGGSEIYSFVIDAGGVSIARSSPVPFYLSAQPVWNGGLVADLQGYIFDLDAGTVTGRVALPAGVLYCSCAPDPAGTSVLGLYSSVGKSDSMAVRFSLANFTATSVLDYQSHPADTAVGAGIPTTVMKTWGAGNVVMNAFDNEGGGSLLSFLQSPQLPAVSPITITPTVDAAGLTHLPVAANGLVYDATRNLLWATVPGYEGPGGNSVISIDPASGRIVDTIYAGSEPGALAISSDGNRLFAGLNGAPAISVVDLNTKQSTSFSVMDPAPDNSIYWFAGSVAAVPNQSNAVLAALVPAGSADYRSSLVVYDGGKPRLQTFSQLGGLSTAHYANSVFPGDSVTAFYAVNAQEYLRNTDYTSNVFHLLVTSRGVSLDRELNSLLFQDANGLFQPNLVYNAGQLYTSTGHIYTPDTSQQLNSVAGFGIPVPFADRGEIAYAGASNDAEDDSAITVTMFDLTRFRPVEAVTIATLTATSGATFGGVTAAVRVGASQVAVAVNGEITLVPLASFQPWPQASVQPQTVSPGVQRVSLTTNAIAALPGASNILISTPSTDGSIGNSMVILDGASGQIQSAVYIGSEPSGIALTPDGSEAYVWLNGELQVARWNVSTGSKDLEFFADPTGMSNQYIPYDMKVGPDGGLGVSYPGGAIAIFDNGVGRPQTAFNTQGPSAPFGEGAFELAFGDNSILYAYDNFLSTFELNRLAVSATGVEYLSSAQNLIVGYPTQIQYARGLIYTSNGWVVNGEKSIVAGRFSQPAPIYVALCAPDLAAGRVYCVGGQGIFVFDAQTYALLGSLEFNPRYTSTALSMVRFGANGLAITTSDGYVYLVSIASIPLLATPVPSPQPPIISPGGVVPVDSTASEITAGSWVSIFGSNLAPAPSIWKGDFPTSLGGTIVGIDSRLAYLSYVSPNQINLQVPDDPTTGTVPVTIATASGNVMAQITLAQVSPSFLLLDTKHVAGIILRSDGSGAYGGGTYDILGPTGTSLGYPTVAARAGDTVELFGTGFGPTSPVVPAGRAFSGSAPAVNAVTLNMNNVTLLPTFAGLSGAGVYQFNLTIPSGLGTGDVPLLGNVARVQSQPGVVISLR